MANNALDKEVVKKMQAAYDEFAKYMAKLESKASSLVKKTLKGVDKDKMDATMAKIKALSDK